MSRTETLKLKYAILMNTYNLDSKLANKEKHKGWDTLYNEYGISKPSNDVTLKEHKIDRAYGKQKLNRFNYAKQLGLDIEEAKKSRYQKKTKIKSQYQYINRNKRRYNYEERERRAKMWREWDRKGHDYPYEIEKEAIRINRENGLDDNASYGYVIQHYIFVSNMDEEVAYMNAGKPDKFTGNPMYRSVEVIG